MGIPALNRLAPFDFIADEIAPRPAGRQSLRWLRPALALAAGAVLVALLASHGEDFLRAFTRALHANWALAAGAALLEALSVAGYVALTHQVISSASAGLRWRDSYDITLAGTAATRLLPTAGLGGAAVTIWALRAHGIRREELAERLGAFLLLLYGIYVATLIAAGGLVAADRGRALALIGVLIGASIAAAVALVTLAPGPLTRILPQRVARHLPLVRAAARRAARELRHPRPALLGAVAWWGFDIAVLGVMLAAFGVTPAIPGLVLAYFLGTLFNVLPLPGSLSGGLLGVLVALGTPAAPAFAAVLAYRAVATWGPAGAGLLSLARLRTSVTAWRAARV